MDIGREEEPVHLSRTEQMMRRFREEGGYRRKPYFFTHGNAVLCTDCAETMMDIDPAKMEAHYHTRRLVMCGGCHVYLGPMTEDERR